MMALSDAELLKEVQKVLREKAALKAAAVSPALKARLVAQIDAKLAELEAVVLKAPEGAAGAVQAPNASRK